MKKYWAHGIAIVSTILTLFALSCSMDLEPAKSGNTSVSFTIGTLIPPANALENLQPVPGRAVAPDYGYLYIRTLGGPTGSKGPFYGPFRLSAGQTFTTTDIPAGTYDGIGILYATEPLESLTGYWNDQKMTFTELMRLPDDQFVLFSDGDRPNGEYSEFEFMIDGHASGEMTRNVTIQANRNTTLRVRLLPMCAGNVLDLDTMHCSVILHSEAPQTMVRKFYEIRNVHHPQGTSLDTLVLSVDPVNAPSVTMGRAILFREDGTAIQTITNGGTYTEKRNFNVSYTSGSTFYLYVEYEGQGSSLAMSANLVPVSPYNRIYYVSSWGEGSGLTPLNTFSSNDLSSILGDTSESTVVLFMDSITPPDSISVGTARSHLFTSLTTQPQEIICTSGYLFLETTAGSKVVITHLVLDGQNTPSINNPLISVSGELTLNEGAVLRNRINNEGPGGIELSGTGSLIMNDGALIEACTSQSGWGGGIYANGDPASVNMCGGIIQNCSANYGGAIALGNGVTLILSGTARIRNCFAEYGWAISADGAPENITPAYDGPEIQNFIEGYNGEAIYINM